MPSVEWSDALAVYALLPVIQPVVTTILLLVEKHYVDVRSLVYFHCPLIAT